MLSITNKVVRIKWMKWMVKITVKVSNFEDAKEKTRAQITRMIFKGVDNTDITIDFTI